MRLLPALLRSVFVGTLFLTPAAATDYFVDASRGVDAHPGSQAQPWRTLTHAFAQPLGAGDRIVIRGVFTAPAEHFPLHLPPGVELTTYGPYGTALIDAGLSAALVLDRPGAYDQAIGISPTSYGLLTIAGAPAIEARPADRSARLRPTFQGLRISGEVRLANESPLPFTGGDFAPRFERCEIDGAVEMRTAATANGARESYLSAGFFDCTLEGALRATGLESSIRFDVERCRLDRGASIANDASDGCDLRFVDCTFGADLVLRGSAFSSRIDVVRCDLGGSAVRIADPGSGYVNVSDVHSASELVVDPGRIAACNHNTVAGRIFLRGDIQTEGVPIGSNRCSSMELDFDPRGRGWDLDVDGNEIIGSGLRIRRLPPYGALVRWNRVLVRDGSDGIRIDGPLDATVGWLHLEENDVRSDRASGSGLLIGGNFAQSFSAVRNFVRGFEHGIRVPYGTRLASPPFSRDAIFSDNDLRSQIGLDLDFREPSPFTWLLIDGNTASHGSLGLRLARDPLAPQRLQLSNNLFAANQRDVDTTGLLASDYVGSNLASDGSLRTFGVPFGPQNYWGDAHFTDPSGEDHRLLVTSPALGTGYDPSSNRIRDIGAVQHVEGRTLSVLRMIGAGGNFLRFRASGPSGGLAWIACAAEPAGVAFIPLGEGLFGLDPATWVFTVGGLVNWGAFELLLPEPPAPYAAVFQAAVLPPEPGASLRASNTLILIGI
ncbi:MAG: hypothetical protein IPN34_02305 [Planctomycetes bacterium]|nr:hypothetical protein [Planctomycetota bacterium]